MKLDKVHEKQGMASNVKLNLEALGCEVDFVTNKEQITKTRIVHEKSMQQLIRIDDDPRLTPCNSFLPQSYYQYDAIVISDYNKGFISADQIKNICIEFLGPIFIDTKKKDLKLFGFNNVFVKINEQEFNSSTSFPKNLIVTRGSKDVQYYRNGDLQDKTYFIKTHKVLDVCGAGDTFLASFSYRYLLTKDIDNAINFAIKASSIAVTHFGNYAPSLREIDDA